jgi:hypothetical protein
MCEIRNGLKMLVASIKDSLYHSVKNILDTTNTACLGPFSNKKRAGNFEHRVGSFRLGNLLMRRFQQHIGLHRCCNIDNMASVTDTFVAREQTDSQCFMLRSFRSKWMPAAIIVAVLQ